MGSEMCIRDRPLLPKKAPPLHDSFRTGAPPAFGSAHNAVPVHRMDTTVRIFGSCHMAADSAVRRIHDCLVPPRIPERMDQVLLKIRAAVLDIPRNLLATADHNPAGSDCNMDGNA